MWWVAIKPKLKFFKDLRMQTKYNLILRVFENYHSSFIYIYIHIYIIFIRIKKVIKKFPMIFNYFIMKKK